MGDNSNKMEIDGDDDSKLNMGTEQETSPKKQRTMEGTVADGAMNVEQLLAELQQERKRSLLAEAKLAAMSSPPTITFREVPEPEIIAFAASLEEIDFSPGVLDNSEDMGQVVLGKLYKPDTKWPIAAQRLDLRLLSRNELFGGPLTAATGGSHTNDDLRPVARQLSDRIRRRNDKTFGLVASPAVGKTSSIVDVGREHFVILMQASHPVDKSSAGRPLSRDFDTKFESLVERVQDSLSLERLDEKIFSHRERAWEVAEQHCLVELIARLAELERMRIDKASRGGVVQPFDFVLHQICGTDDFVCNVVSKLENWDVPSLFKLTELLMKNLRHHLLSNEHKLVIALDEIESARSIKVGWFSRPGTSEEEKEKKGLLSPLSYAAGKIAKRWKLNIILAGTGSSKAKIENMQTDLGKTKDEKIYLFTQENFPMTSVADVNALLSRLNIPAGDVPKLSEGRRNHVIEGGVNRMNSLKDLLETYVIGARYRVIMGALEKVQKYFEQNGEQEPAWIVLRNVLRLSIMDHSEGIVRTLRRRLGPGIDQNAAFKLSRDVFDSVEMLFVGAAMTNGAARFNESSLNLVSDPKGPAVDLTELGIVSVVFDVTDVAEPATGHSNAIQRTFVGITEAFVFDALGAYLASEDVQNLVNEWGIQSNVALLNKVLGEFGKEVQFKGNVVEYALLCRLVELAKTCQTVGELPFVKPVLEKNPAMMKEWSHIPYTPQGIQEPSSQMSTPAFLSKSPNAFSVVYWPEDVCRPDAIVMLRDVRAPASLQNPPPPVSCFPRISDILPSIAAPVRVHRAMTLACAVYSLKVDDDKMKDQTIYSSNMSCAFLSKKAGKVYAKTATRRKEWFKEGLHNTRTIRVCVALPCGNSVPETESSVKETSEGGGIYKNTSTDEDDLVITLDRSNIHLLLGKEDKYNDLYALLKVATKCYDGWV